MYLKVICFLTLFVSIANAKTTIIKANNTKPTIKYILGGEYILEKQIPYLAALFKYGFHTCGGTIIAKNWILTAAHCFTKGTDGFSVTVGTVDLKKESTYYIAQSIYIHENYDKVSKDNDIALIKLIKPIEFDEKAKPIEITDKLPKVGDKVTISGFGNTGALYNGQLGKTATVKITDQKDCRPFYPDTVMTNNMICAFAKKTDACAGDSGGPAVINNKVAGIVSFGYHCDWPTDAHGVYTNVYNYRKWIADITGLKL